MPSKHYSIAKDNAAYIEFLDSVIKDVDRSIQSSGFFQRDDVLIADHMRFRYGICANVTEMFIGIEDGQEFKGICKAFANIPGLASELVWPFAGKFYIFPGLKQRANFIQ